MTEDELRDAIREILLTYHDLYSTDLEVQTDKIMEAVQAFNNGRQQ